MSDKARLLRGILEQPEDDTLRLIYADWLEEQGQDERAGWMRWQIQHAKQRSGRFALKMEEGPPRTVHPVHYRYEKTWDGGRQWRIVMGILQDSPSMTGTLVFDRGFVYDLGLTLASFLGCAKTLFALHPITRVALTDKEPCPIAMAGDLKSAWRMRRVTLNMKPWEIPEHLWKLLVGDRGRRTSGYQSYKTYDSMLLAKQDLERAAVAYGRSLNGLSPLGYE